MALNPASKTFWRDLARKVPPRTVAEVQEEYNRAVRSPDAGKARRTKYDGALRGEGGAEALTAAETRGLRRSKVAQTFQAKNVARSEQWRQRAANERGAAKRLRVVPGRGVVEEDASSAEVEVSGGDSGSEGGSQGETDRRLREGMAAAAVADRNIDRIARRRHENARRERAAAQAGGGAGAVRPAAKFKPGSTAAVVMAALRNAGKAREQSEDEDDRDDYFTDNESSPDAGEDTWGGS
ncbi:unnamed protein product [Pedinophyceae sp. YPF-701]|nr:unnamed protein product [Pedinophyceae sp. YPF-701]